MSTRSPKQIKHFISKNIQYIDDRILEPFVEEKLKRQKVAIAHNKSNYNKKNAELKKNETKEGFKQLLKTYNDKEAWIIYRNRKPLPDPIAESFIYKNNKSYLAMLQIIFHEKTKATKIIFDKDKEYYDAMFDKVFEGVNRCAYCRNIID